MRKKLAEGMDEQKRLAAIGNALATMTNGMISGKGIEESTKDCFLALAESGHTSDFVKFLNESSRSDGRKTGLWQGYLIGVAVSIVVFVLASLIGF